MSHPIPGHDYGEELPNKNVRLNALQKAMGKFLDNTGNYMKKDTESDFEYLKRMVGSRNKALNKKKSIPKYGRYGNKKPNMPNQSPHLPPGYKQSDLE